MSKIEQIEHTIDGNTNINLSTKRQCEQRKTWFFTFNNYTLEDIEQIERVLRDLNIAYIFQEELSESKTQHLQGFIKSDKRIRWTELKLSKKIHWEKCINEKASIAYCSKDETRNGKIFKYKIKIEEPLRLITPSKGWQKNIIEMIKEEADDRKIYWYVDEVGGIGKSCLSKYLCAKHEALCLMGKSSDMKYGIIAYKQKFKIYPKVVILDIARETQNKISYSGIEQVKNGCFFNTKYECDMVLMNPPHIIIFSNFEPDYEKLSKDRFIVTAFYRDNEGIEYEEKIIHT